MVRVFGAVAVLPALAVALTLAVAVARPLPDSQLWRILDATPQLVRERSPLPAIPLRYVRMRGAAAQGYVNPALTDYGRLGNGQPVLIVPLGSGGSGGVFYTLLFTRLNAKSRFVGYVPSTAGHLQVSLARGLLHVVTPVYGARDAQCCPSRHLSRWYTVRGLRLVPVGGAALR